MFEASLLPQRKGKDARLIRGIAFGSVALQVVGVAAFIVVPLIYPDTLPSIVRPPKLTRIELKKPEIKIVPVKPVLVRASNDAAISAPAHAQPVVEIRRAGMFTRTAATSDIEPALVVGGGTIPGVGISASVGTGMPMASGVGAVVTVAKPVAPASDKPLNVSSGVSRGLLIDPIRPIYPAIARATRQEGTVVVTAVIDKSGRIVNAQVVDGPMMLREAAISAVRVARYRPYLLNGLPTEVVTTVSITFRMSVVRGELAAGQNPGLRSETWGTRICGQVRRAYLRG